jgi:hypothetical protein
MFDRANLDDLRIGYVHFSHADIHVPKGNHVPENTMQRYTLWAYVSQPKTATFNINYADRCVIYVDDIVQEIYIDAGGNFGQVPKLAVINLKQGWTRLQFLLANETQEGGLIVSSDLYEKADYLSNLDYFAGLITGDRIQAGSLDERHFSPNMDLVVHTLHATATDVPGIVIGNADEQGIIQIGDGTITKAKDEPFTFDQGIRVNGFIRVTQLLIDVDFIRAGDGMIVKTIKDEYGYTQMYEIINDLRLVDGGGILVAGNGQEGYTITNDLQIRVNPLGGLTITGDPIRGYELSNDMELGSLGGIDVTGDPLEGYYVRNTMKLTSDFGIIKVTGDAWTGYSLKNVLEVLAGGGIDIRGAINEGEITIVNDMSLKVKNPNDMLEITGDAEHGYFIEGTWPTFTAKDDVVMTDDRKGNYTISVKVHVKEVKADASTFITVAEQSAGVHQIGIDDTKFYAQVKDIIGKETHVKDVNSDIDFIKMTHNANGDHRLSIPDYDKMIPWIQKGQAPWMFGVPSSSPSIGPGGTFNAGNPQFVETTSVNFVLAGFFAGVVPAGTADCLRMTSQGGWEGSSSTVEIKIVISMNDPDNGGSWDKTFYRTISSALNTGNYNEVIHTIPIPVRDYWRHYDVSCYVRRASGTGKANAQFRELWSDTVKATSAHSGTQVTQ